ncbi:hypothetical protein JOM56_013369 [Amanita muscaria]
MDNNDQRNLSEQLQLLHELRYSDLDMPYQGAGTLSNSHLGLPSAIEPPVPVHPIGVSKRSCFCCTLWINSHNRIFGTRWMTSGSHGKPYANWALPGAACSYAIRADGRSSVDKAVLDPVSMRLTDTLDWLSSGQKRISDEYVSSGDDSESSDSWAADTVDSNLITGQGLKTQVTGSS